MSEPQLPDLIDGIVVLRNERGDSERYVVDHASERTLICSFLLRGRAQASVRWSVGELVELGLPDDRGGWLVATGEVMDARLEGSVTVRVDQFGRVQRRQAYREEVVVPLVIRPESSDEQPRRGRTENLSATGFAARLNGAPYPEGTELVVTLSMPEGDDLTLACRKVGGDLPQRFELTGLDRSTEERLTRLVRAAELARRRAERDAE